VLQEIGDREARQIGSERPRVELGDVEQRIEQIVHDRDRGIDLRGDPAALHGVGLGAQLRDEQIQGMQGLAQSWLAAARKRDFARFAASSCR
jgi:hypothetical protein